MRDQNHYCGPCHMTTRHETRNGVLVCQSCAREKYHLPRPQEGYGVSLLDMSWLG